MAKFLRLENVEDTAKRHPETFFIPALSERKSQNVGSSVRLHFLLQEADASDPRAERMWVKITQERGFFRPYKGVLENAPALIADLHQGDEIAFEPRHIAETVIKKDDPRWVDSANLKALVSEMCFDKGETIRFLYRQKADREEDSGWRMFSAHETEEYVDALKNVRIVDVGHMLSLDPTLLEPLKEGIGAVFERDEQGMPWQRVTDWSPED